MPRYDIKPKYRLAKINGHNRGLLSKADFDRFNIDLLGLGNVLAPSESIDTIAAVYDLEGFTNFSKQIEPQLSVPHYLNSFLVWLMQQLRDEMREADHEGDVILRYPLPFFAKFLGDGLLILWDASGTGDIRRPNIVLSAHQICERYRSHFLPTLKRRVVEPPPALRCGVARGTVLSVGEGQDFVGSCINMAARLQKLPGISFCFNQRGFDIEDKKQNKFFNESIVVKEVSIRGIGDHELICILRSEAEALSPKDRKFYKDVEYG